MSILNHNVYAQHRQLESWRYYFNNQDYFDIEKVENDLYVNAHRAIFDVSIDPFEVNQIDKIAGLSEYSISTMSYNPEEKILIVAYSNTMIDIISYENGSKKIKSNYDLFNKLLVADKSILSIKFLKGKAYLCTKIGIVVLDYKKNEIEATYIIGDLGDYMPVYTIELLDNKFYASTNKGVKSALDNVALNLQDYHNWNIHSGFPFDSFHTSLKVADKLLFLSQFQLIEFNGTASNLIIPKDTLRRLKKIKNLDGSILVLYDSLKNDKSFYSSKLLNLNSNSIIIESKERRLNDFQKLNGKMYYSSNAFLVDNAGSLSELGLSVNPYDYPFRLQLDRNRLIVNMGVMARNGDATLNKTGFFVKDQSFIYQNGIWSDSLSDCTNQISSIYMNGGLFRAFVRGGISFEKNNTYTRFRNTNSTLESDGSSYRITDMVLNPMDSSIWIGNSSSSKPLKCLRKDGKWFSFDISSITSSTLIYKIVIDQAGNKWLLMRNDGLILFNENDIANTSDDIIRKYDEIKSSNGCNLSIKTCNCAVVDNDGTLWVGAEKGVGAITSCTYNPRVACDLSIPTQTIITPNDTTLYTECAFLNTPVTALAVDAGNNIWVGTPDGIFYNQEYLSLEHLRLNRLNSPFSARSIFDILVHPENGEVFIASDVGLLSYMGQSISGIYNAEKSPYLIIPNPVPNDYEGLISIDGLPENAFYKITDVIGNLMYQGQSNGSRVSWDGKSLSGVKVPTGVYFIFSGLRELKGKTGVGKFTIIR